MCFRQPKQQIPLEGLLLAVKTSTSEGQAMGQEKKTTKNHPVHQGHTKSSALPMTT